MYYPNIVNQLNSFTPFEDAGELTYEEVAVRNNEYQQLAQEYPVDQQITEKRDLYMKYLSAYNFYNRNKALEALKTNI